MKESKPIKLTSVANAIEGEMLMNLLINNNISSYKLDQCTGDYMNIYMGYSVYGEDIYVDEHDYDKAKEILDSIQVEEFTDELIEQKTWTKKRIIVCVLVSVYILAIFITIFLNSFINIIF